MSQQFFTAQEQADIIRRVFEKQDLTAKIVKWDEGAAYNRFQIALSAGTKIQKLSSALDFIRLELRCYSIRMEAPIPGTALIGLEVPHHRLTPILYQQAMAAIQGDENTPPLSFPLGCDVTGKIVSCNLEAMPHLLIGGSAGSGKSVCLHSMICTLIKRNSPQQLGLILIDPKAIEFNLYQDIPHLLTPVVSNTRGAIGALAWLVDEMRRRYQLFSAHSCRSITHYNEEQADPAQRLQRIVVVIDELSDLMADYRHEAEDYLRQLSALARSSGIHLVMATQRPSVEVITGVIKNNFPSRIAFYTPSGIDSRNILDSTGAENLIGRGDMLYKPVTGQLVRVQGCLITEEECRAIAEGLIGQPQYIPAIEKMAADSRFARIPLS